MRDPVVKPSDVVFAICRKLYGIGEFSNSYCVWFAAKSAIEYPTGTFEYDCLKNDEKERILSWFPNNCLMLEVSLGADEVSLECEPFDRINVKKLIVRLKQMGFIHNQTYQNSVDSEF